jgi:hypothetical protein
MRVAPSVVTAACILAGCAEMSGESKSSDNPAVTAQSVSVFARACLDTAPSFEGAGALFRTEGITALEPGVSPSSIVRGAPYAIIGDYEGKGARCGLFVPTRNEDNVVEALRGEVGARYSPEVVSVFTENSTYAKRFFIDVGRAQFLFAGVTSDFASPESGRGTFIASWESDGPPQLKK